jgi:hypothetical protein
MRCSPEVSQCIFITIKAVSTITSTIFIIFVHFLLKCDTIKKILDAFRDVMLAADHMYGADAALKRR